MHEQLEPLRDRRIAGLSLRQRAKARRVVDHERRLHQRLFDFLFTSGLSRALEFVPSSQPVTITQQAATSTVVATSSDTSAPNFGIPTK